MINTFFTWFGGVLSDPHDQQGSTKRLCLFLFLGTIMVLLTLVTVASDPMTLPAIPASVLDLVYFVVGVLVSAVVADKGIAAYKDVAAAVLPTGPKSPTSPTSDTDTDRPAGAL